MTSEITKLKLFIEAAELIGGAEWVPNHDQWNNIKNRILNLPDGEQPAPTLNYPPGVRSPQPQPQLQLSQQSQQTLFGGQMMVPPQPATPSPEMGGAPSDVPVKLRVNPDGTPAPAFR